MPLKIDLGTCRMLIDYSVPWVEHDDTLAGISVWVFEGRYLIEQCMREGKPVGKATSKVVLDNGITKWTGFGGMRPRGVGKNETEAEEIFQEMWDRGVEGSAVAR